MTLPMKAPAGRVAPILLGAGCVAWAAAPLIHTAYATLMLFLAGLGMAVGALRLALAAIAVPEEALARLKTRRRELGVQVCSLFE